MWTALLHERQDQPDEAEALYKSALAAGKPDSTETADTLTLYARFLQQHGRDGEAQAIRERTNWRPGPAASEVQPPRRPLTAYRVGGGVIQPAVISKADPVYTEEARIARISGTVLLQLVVDVDGQAKNIKVVKSVGFGLDDCAIESILKWQFRPGQKNGSPVPVYATVEINFKLL